MTTKAEREFQNAIREIGCIICLRQGHPGTPCDIHHILSGGKRLSEMAVLGLCPSHHRGGNGDGRFISRHPFKTRFEKSYGTEAELLQRTKQLVRHERTNEREAA